MNNQEQKISLTSIIILLIGAVFFFYEYMVQLSFTVMIPEIMGHFSIGATQIGWIATTFLIVYSGMQLPVGVMLDRFGPKRLLSVASISCALGCALFGSSPIFWQLLLGRGLIAFGSAFALISCLKLVANWFPPRRFALLSTLTIAIGMLGATCGQAPAAILVGKFGWQNSNYIFAAIGLILSILIIIIIRDQPIKPESSTTHNKIPLLQGLKHVIAQRQNWITAIYGGLMYAPTLIFGGLWGVTYIAQKYGYPKAEAGLIVSSIYIGWAIGGPIFGWISDTLERRKLPMYISSSVALLFITVAIYANGLDKITLTLLLFGFGVFSSGFPLSFVVIQEMNPSQYTGAALGFMNTINQAVGAIIAPIFGMVLDFWWKGAMVDNIKIYATTDYAIALSVVPLLVIISIAFLPFMRETNCRVTKL